MVKKLALFAASFGSAFGLVSMAHAQVATSTFTTAVSTTIADVSSIAATVIVAVLAFVGLLIGGGWAWRFLKRHIGRKI